MEKRTLALLLIVIMVGLGIYLYLDKLQRNVTFDSFHITKAEDASLSGFTVVGTLAVRNANSFPIRVKSVVYEFLLKEQNVSVGRGSLGEIVLAPKDVTVIPFQQRVTIGNGLDFVIGLVKSPKVIVVIEGKATIDAKLLDYDVPFGAEMDVKSYLLEMIPTPKEVLADSGLKEAAVNQIKAVVTQIAAKGLNIKPEQIDDAVAQISEEAPSESEIRNVAKDEFNLTDEQINQALADASANPALKSVLDQIQ